jgi:DnaJ-class molecular chaperone
MKCDRCDGSGEYVLEGIGYGGTGTYRRSYRCDACGGSGKVDAAAIAEAFWCEDAHATDGKQAERVVMSRYGITREELHQFLADADQQ